MIDLHCHILPQMDDGAGDRDTALMMLERERRSGVDRVILTPHFYPEEQSQEEFLQARDRAWNVLREGMRDDAGLRLGAEVAYSAQLFQLDLRKLTLGGSRYLLLELPRGRYPAYMERITEQLLDMGLIPILAHVERYGYFRQEPALLARLVEMGLLAQVTAAALTDRRDRNFAGACLEHGLAQIVASDAHDLFGREPRMELLSGLSDRVQRIHRAFTEAVWDDDMPPYMPLTDIRYLFFRYR